MDIEIAKNILLIFFLFLCSAFFSGSEVALFSLDKEKLNTIFPKNNFIFRYTDFLLSYPRRLLVTILISNTIVNVAASIIAVMLALKIAHNHNINEDLVLTIQIIIVTLVVILFGELTPKIWALKNPIGFTKVVIFPLYWVSAFLFPVSEILTEILKTFSSKFKLHKKYSAISEEEISQLAEVGAEKGAIEHTEQEIIQSLVSYKKVSVKEIMTPRVDVVYVENIITYNDLINTITETGHSRIPVCRETIDNIIGIVFAKDLLPYLLNEEKQKNFLIEKIVRQPLIVPEKKLIKELMQEFQEKKLHIAVVVDEYGGTSGIITLEDILEEIIGEINDELDEDLDSIIQVDKNSYLVLGSLSIITLKNELNIDLFDKDKEYDTVGGFILSHYGAIPHSGYYILKDDFKFTVKEVLNKRIKKVLIEKVK